MAAAAMGMAKGTSADRPENPAVGDQFVNGTLGITEVYTENDGWQPLTSSSTGIPFGTTIDRPTPELGQPYFNSDESRLELYTTTTGWQNIVQETPSVISIDATYLEFSGPQEVTINGTNFTAGATAVAIDADGIEVPADLTTLVSVVQVVATFTGLSAENSPYDIKITNPSNLYGILYDALQVDDIYIWDKQSGSLGTYVESSPLSVITTSIFSSNNSPVSFSISSGSLPPGISLNTTSGEISGSTINLGLTTTYNFSIEATDGQNVSSRNFSITITDSGPVWQTPQQLQVFAKDVPYATTVEALENDGNQVSYSLLSGSLPTGLSVDASSGVISGVPSSFAKAIFTLRATDVVSGSYSDRQFTIPNEVPAWQTPSTFDVYTDSNSIQLSATDDSELTSLYSIMSGSLPSGMTLSSSGVLSGGSSLSDGQTATFVIRATDTNGGYSDKEFTVTTRSRLYPFVSHTFTPAGANGRNGPSLSQVLAAYNSTSWASSNMSMATTGKQLWKVPMSGTYRFVVAGSAGQSSAFEGGFGAKLTVDVPLSANDIIEIGCGQKSPSNVSSLNVSGGGGGASWVAASSGGAPIIVAGGGGGGGGPWTGSGYNGSNGSTSISGFATTPNDFGNTTDGSPGLTNGGWGGNGNSQANSNPGYNGTAGGGGWSTKGNDGYNSSFGGNAISASAVGGTGGDASGENHGGFGGGGGSRNVAGAGGGGYTGGNGSEWANSQTGGGGGGGSYVSGIATLISAVADSNGQGYVTVTKL